MEAHERLQRARQARGFETPSAAAEAFGWNRNTYISNENGNASFSFKKAKVYAAAFGVRAEWLYDESGPMKLREEPVSPILGLVGADGSGEVLFATGQEAHDVAPRPPGGSSLASALEVRGHSMSGFADDGALIYFENQRTPPTPDMLGNVVVVQTENDQVLVKRLLRGSERGLYDLESIIGPTLTDQRVVWAAEITAIIPPRQARRIIVRGAERVT